jgi:cardiolipin synthase (CMP-forming)
VLNLSNRITILRILMVPLIVIFLSYDFKRSALGLFFLAGVTDALDGFFARIRREKTQLGTILDPIADKALLVSTFVALSVRGLLPFWLVILVISRDLILVLGSVVIYMMTGHLKIAPTILGKLTTASQLIIVLDALMRNISGYFIIPRPFFPLLVAFFTVSSGLHYVWIGAKSLNTNSSP